MPDDDHDHDPSRREFLGTAGVLSLVGLDPARTAPADAATDGGDPDDAAAPEPGFTTAHNPDGTHRIDVAGGEPVAATLQLPPTRDRATIDVAGLAFDEGEDPYVKADVRAGDAQLSLSLSPERANGLANELHIAALFAMDWSGR